MFKINIQQYQFCGICKKRKMQKKVLQRKELRNSVFTCFMFSMICHLDIFPLGCLSYPCSLLSFFPNKYVETVLRCGPAGKRTGASIFLLVLYIFLSHSFALSQPSLSLLILINFPQYIYENIVE